MKDTHTKERMDAKKDRIEARLKDAQADVKEAWVNAKEKNTRGLGRYRKQESSQRII